MMKDAMAREHMPAPRSPSSRTASGAEEGYGFASLAPTAGHPDRTSSRGSISKTFTWIALMKESRPAASA